MCHCTCNRDDEHPENVGKKLVKCLRNIFQELKAQRALWKLHDDRIEKVEESLEYLKRMETNLPKSNVISELPKSCPVVWTERPQATEMDVAIGFYRAQRTESGSGNPPDEDGFERLSKDIQGWRLASPNVTISREELLEPNDRQIAHDFFETAKTQRKEK